MPYIEPGSTIGNEAFTASGTASGALRPWQAVTVGSGLVLHAASTLRAEPAPLQSEFALLDASVDPDGRNFLASDGSWCAIALVERSRPLSGALPSPGAATPALAYRPTVRALLSRTAWTLLSCYVLRQPPRGILAWHVDPQALHLQECRLLVPIQAPDAAVTLIGHDAAAYPVGTAPTGDFNFRHQVENATDGQRIVLAIDVLCEPDVRRLLPPALADVASLRRELAREACHRLLPWRARESVGDPRWVARRLADSAASAIRRRAARYDTVTAEVTRAPTVVAPAPCARLQR
jgi:hypothetical protein